MSVSTQIVSPALAETWLGRFLHSLSGIVEGVTRTTCEAALAEAFGASSWSDVLSRGSGPAHVPGHPSVRAPADSAPLTLPLIKGWAKAASRGFAKVGVQAPLAMCQKAWAHALGCSGWKALPGQLLVLNREREALNVQALNAASTRGHRPPLAEAPVAAKDWVMEKEVDHPELGRVLEVYWDDTAHEWVMNVVLYRPDGTRIGRSSPRMGGPAGFEPCVPCQYWDRIEKPEFPMVLDRTGYRDWRDGATVLPPRSPGQSEKQVLEDDEDD